MIGALIYSSFYANTRCLIVHVAVRNTDLIIVFLFFVVFNYTSTFSRCFGAMYNQLQRYTITKLESKIDRLPKLEDYEIKTLRPFVTHSPGPSGYKFQYASSTFEV